MKASPDTFEDMEAVFANTTAPVETGVTKKKIKGLSGALRAEVEEVLGYKIGDRSPTSEEFDQVFDYDADLAFDILDEECKENRPTPKELGDLLLRLMKEQNG